MEIVIELNGKKRNVTRDQVFLAASKGLIGPETIIWVDGSPFKARKIRGLKFKCDEIPIQEEHRTNTHNDSSSVMPIRTDNQEIAHGNQKTTNKNKITIISSCIAAFLSIMILSVTALYIYIQKASKRTLDADNERIINQYYKDIAQNSWKETENGLDDKNKPLIENGILEIGSVSNTEKHDYDNTGFLTSNPITKGVDLKKLLYDLLSTRKSSERNEYETSEQHKERLSQLSKNAFCDNLHMNDSFLIEMETEQKYNADTKELELYLQAVDYKYSVVRDKVEEYIKNGMSSLEERGREEAIKKGNDFIANAMNAEEEERKRIEQDRIESEKTVSDMDKNFRRMTMTPEERRADERKEDLANAQKKVDEQVRLGGMYIKNRSEIDKAKEEKEQVDSEHYKMLSDYKALQKSIDSLASNPFGLFNYNHQWFETISQYKKTENDLKELTNKSSYIRDQIDYLYGNRKEPAILKQIDDNESNNSNGEPAVLLARIERIDNGTIQGQNVFGAMADIQQTLIIRFFLIGNNLPFNGFFQLRDVSSEQAILYKDSLKIFALCKFHYIEDKPPVDFLGLCKYPTIDMPNQILILDVFIYCDFIEFSLVDKADNKHIQRISVDHEL